MKTIKIGVFFASAIALMSLNSCKKCHDCHYDKDGQEIEIGEICDEDQINDYEKNGYKVDTMTYVVHCHEH
jgi:hypothetical protein